MELKVETWQIDRLIPYARNPRKNDAVVKKAESGKTFDELAEQANV